MKKPARLLPASLGLVIPKVLTKVSVRKSRSLMQSVCPDQALLPVPGVLEAGEGMASASWQVQKHLLFSGERLRAMLAGATLKVLKNKEKRLCRPHL